MTLRERDDVEVARGALLQVIEEFSDTVGIENFDVIRRLTASVERSLTAERLRGKIDIRRRHR